jgi:hypothetical protein
MIVNFKIFESNNNEYNVGDYILLEGSYFSDGEVKKSKITTEHKNATISWYYVNLIIDNKVVELFLDSKMIIRKLEPKEIEEFELEYTTLKFNL